MTLHKAAITKTGLTMISASGRAPALSIAAGFGKSTVATTAMATSATLACARKLAANR